MLVDTDFGDASGRAPGLEVASWKEGTPDPAQWDELARSASEPNPFFERWFLKPSLEAFDPQGSVSLAQLQCDGRLVALVPIRLSRNYYGRPVPHFSVWLHENAFCGVPLIARGFEAMFWSALLRWVDEHAGIASFLHLPGLPEGCGPDTVLAELVCDLADHLSALGKRLQPPFAESLLASVNGAVHLTIRHHLIGFQRRACGRIKCLKLFAHNMCLFRSLKA